MTLRAFLTMRCTYFWNRLTRTTSGRAAPDTSNDFFWGKCTCAPSINGRLWYKLKEYGPRLSDTCRITRYTLDNRLSVWSWVLSHFINSWTTSLCVQRGVLMLEMTEMPKINHSVCTGQDVSVLPTGNAAKKLAAPILGQMKNCQFGCDSARINFHWKRGF